MFTTKKKRVVLANDHSAVEFREEVRLWLANNGYEVTDLGISDEQSVDYPDMASKACQEYLAHEEDYEFGILICGTGIGISIAANHYRDIRCALVHDEVTGRLAKEHNNANFLALGARTEQYAPISVILDAYAKGEFAGGRHLVRINKIAKLENK